MNKLGLLSLLFYLISLGFGYQHVAVIPSHVQVQEGEGFLIKLKLDGQITVQTCQLTRNNKLYFFTSGQNKSHVLSGGEMINPFLPDNPYECGVRVFNVSQSSVGTWKLSSVSESGDQREGSMTVSVLPKVGSSCPVQNCKMVNYETLEEAPCGTKQWTNYECNYLSDGKLSESHTMNSVNSFPLDDPWITTTSGNKVLECLADTKSWTVINCTIENLFTGKRFKIKEGLLDSRYSAFETNFATGVCQFELPIDVTEEEVGVWKMTMTVQNRYQYKTDLVTCQFQIRGDDEKKAKKALQKRTESKLVIKTLNRTVLIHCAKNVYYPLRLCYLITEKELIFQERAELEKGSCGFYVPPGNWTCGFNAETDEEGDYIQRIEVINYPTALIDEAVTVGDNSSAVTLECHYIYRTPIDLCMFLSPSGTVYRPTSDHYNSTVFRYFDGGSMATGDCGITFNRDVPVESGKWQCITDKGENGDKLVASINIGELKDRDST